MFTRRRLLGGAAALAGLPLFGGLALGGCGSTSSGARAGWCEPSVRSSSDGRLATTLRTATGPAVMGGSKAEAETYEGTYPGPTLAVRAGDVLQVDLVNDLKHVTNLHTHGLHVSPKPPSDDVLSVINSGDTFRYVYHIPNDHPAGTYWYHAHAHGLTDFDVFAGLFGLLIVRGELDELPGVVNRPERVIMISQTEIKDGGIVSGEDSALSAQVTLVNGVYQPAAEIAPGEVQRWRILNASSVFLRLQLEGHPLHVIAIDGNPLTATQTLDLLELPPGGRADVLVQGADAGAFKFRSLSWTELGAFYSSMVPVGEDLFTLTSRGARVDPPGIPTSLLPFDDLRHAAIDRRRNFVLEEVEPRGTGQNDRYHYYINGKEFDHHVVNETMMLGATEEWEFINRTYEPHPMHIHVYPFQVVAVNGQPVDEQHYRDTATLPPFGTLTIRTRFLDFTGLFVMHCHILFHEDHGMMQLLEVVDH